MIVFELLNILARSQGYMNKTLTKKINVFVIVYLNNILIYTKNKS